MPIPVGDKKLLELVQELIDLDKFNTRSYLHDLKELAKRSELTNEKILAILRLAFPARRVWIVQLEGDLAMTMPAVPPIKGTVPGSSSIFQYFVDGAIQAGALPSWSSADANVTFVPSPDGDPTKIQVNLAAAETGAAYPLSVSIVSSSGSTLTDTEQVPVIPAPPPPPPPATAVKIGQIS